MIYYHGHQTEWPQFLLCAEYMKKYLDHSLTCFHITGYHTLLCQQVVREGRERVSKAQTSLVQATHHKLMNKKERYQLFKNTGLYMFPFIG